MTYTHADYEKLVAKTVAQIHNLSKVKGGEYAGDVDRLANFRRNGKALGLPQEVIWAVYAAKHWDAVIQYIQDLSTDVTRTRGEPISGRLDDLIVYCILFKAMIEERENAASNSRVPVRVEPGADDSVRETVPARQPPPERKPVG